MHHVAFAVLVLSGLAPVPSGAQIAPSGAYAPNVVHTASGIEQVDITKPSGAGVSLNTYSRFDVQRAGAILNNSPTITRTQLGGQINGNPNFGAHDAARIIVNQVDGNSPGQLHGYLEVAGSRADVVVANPSGIVVDGGGFINTTRGVLTTGTPFFDANGSLAGFSVTGGRLTVQGAGLNASNVDEVDLIARAVQVNAALYANTLNAVTGSNRVDYASLAPTPVAGNDAAPAVSIDVSQLGGMYANRIALVGTGKGVGVNNAGVLAAQTGDLTLTTDGQLVQSGQATASGDVAIAAGSVDNGGTIYARRNTLVDAAGTLANSGTLAARQDTTANAGNVASTGLLAAGIDDDGSLVGTPLGNLAVTASGALSATGRNVAPGTVTLRGTGLDLSGAQTWAGTVLALTVGEGDLDLADAATGAGGAIAARAAGTLDNSGGRLNAPQLEIVAGHLANRGGTIEQTGTGAAHIAVSDVLDNEGGTVQANGTLGIAAQDIANDGGAISNGGIGTTTISAMGALTNTNGGLIGGNGDVTISGQSLSNTDGARIVAGHDLTLDESRSVNNAGGTLSAANDLTLNGSGAAVSNAGGAIDGGGAVSLDAASLDNTSGRIGSDLGSLSIATGTLTNQGGAIGSGRNLTLTANRLAGDGTLIAGLDAVLTLNGSDTNGAAGLIQANRDLTFTVAGKLTNQGTLAAVGSLTVNAVNVDNQAGADLNSASTIVTAAGAIANEGRIEGDTVVTRSATLANTGTLIGNTVTLTGTQSIVNAGAMAVIAAAVQANLYSPGSISNMGGANVFSLGDVNIAADAARDADGLLANRANAVTNDQSTIEAQGNLEIAARTLTNARPAPDVETVTTGVSTVHEAKRPKYMACATGNADNHSSCPQAVWDDGYRNPVDATFSRSQIVSEVSGPQADADGLVVDVNGQRQTIWYNAITDNGDGTVTVNYWDDYDPGINYLPSTEYPSRSDGHNGYQRVEIARDTITTTQQDQVVGPEAQQGRLLAGGNMTLANVGTLDNDYSAMAAGGSIRIGGTTQEGAPGSGDYGDTTVDNVGQTLYQYQTQDVVSTYAWNEDITRDVGQVVEPSVVLAPIVIGGTGGTIIAGSAVGISGTDIHNTNVAAANSAAGATGGTLGANALLAGQKAGAPQTAADSSGLLHITLPASDLYSLHAVPDAPYLVETDPRFTGYATFISSDYMLQQLGLDPQAAAKRLGDGLYEEQLVRNQITQLMGGVRLHGYPDNLDEYQALMASGVNVAKQFDLEVGAALTPAQMDALTSDIVWLVSETVTLPDGSTQQVLTPVVYLARTHADDLQPTGALIAADDVELHATGSVTHSGVIRGGTQTAVTGTDIVNRAGTIGSSAIDGTTVVSATHDVANASGLITGSRVAVLAGNDITNATLVDTTGISSDAGESRFSESLVGRQGAMASTGDLTVSAGNDLDVHGATITAGGNASIGAGHDLIVDAVQAATTQAMEKNADRHWEAHSVANETSVLSAGGGLAMQSGNDMTLRGAQVMAGGDLAAVAGGNLTATTVTDKAKYDNVAADSQTRQETDRTYDEQAVGTALTAGGNAMLAAIGTDAGRGNVTLTGSSLTAGMVNGVDMGTGAANIAATGNVTLGEAREAHDSGQSVASRRGSFVSGSTSDTMQDTHANVGVGSTVSGNSVNLSSGNDLTVQGSSVVGTHDVNLAAAGNVDITTSQDAATQDRYDHQTHSGLMTSGLSVTIGHQSLTDTDQTSTVTNNVSVIGSSTGNVSVTAGHDLALTGSEVVAGRNVALTGQNVTVNAAYDTYDASQAQQFSQSGLSIGMGGGLLGLGQAMAGTVRQGVQSGDSRLAAVQGVEAAELAYQNRGAIGETANVVSNGDVSQAASNLQVQVSIGSSHSSSNATTSMASAKGSSIIGNGNVVVTATGQPDSAGTPDGHANGNAQADTGDIAMTGATVMGQNVVLDANDTITLQSAQSAGQDSSSNRSGGWSAGAAFGVTDKSAGFGIFGGMSNAHGRGNGSSVTQGNTTVMAGNTLAMSSGGDMTLSGAQVSGNTALVNVGGNLTMTSRQDTSNYANNQHVSAIGGSLTYGAGGSANVSVGHTGIDSSYASVAQQTGIVAGAGGFDVNVAGHTQLNGAEIASAAPAESNRLVTGSLGFSNIENSMLYSGSSEGFSLQGGPGFAQMGGNAGGVTQAAVSPGTITVRPDQQDGTDSTEGLSRDTANANQTVKNTFDLQRVQSDLAFAQAFGRAATYAAGQVADQLEGRNPAFAEGGVARNAMHAAVAAIGAALSGGNMAGAVGGSLTGDALQSLARPIIDQAVAQVPLEDQVALRNALNEIVATAGGAAGGGLAGESSSGVVAGTGAAIDDELYNRQLHPDERTLAKHIAQKSAGQYTQEQVEDQMRIMGMCAAGGGCVSLDVAEELNGRTPTDPGAQWINTGLTNANGNPLVIQSLPEANQALQMFIMENYNSATPGQVPSLFTYLPTPVPTDVRGMVANVAGGVSTAAGRFGAITAAGATLVPPPYSSALQAAAFAGTTTGWIADFVSQLARPDPGAYVASGVVDVTLGGLANKYPLTGPVITEIGAQIKDINSVKKAGNDLNNALGVRK
ncbi:filamentous hemagglutinin [Burkholderia sp. WAC0059]|nr:filamentous hemagglutinin [Burkholderia sp. WAC0059]